LLPGVTAVACRAMEAIAFLLVAGAVLLLVEPLVPHFIAAAIGLTCWALAVVLTYFRYGFAMGNWTLAGTLAFALAGTWWYLKRLPSTRVGRIVQSDHVVPTDSAAKSRLLNQTGTALTPLRPGGMAQIGQERIDVVTSGEPLERGQSVKVVGIEGSRVLVRAVASASTYQPENRT
jgi:membrane-bound serine protease (ClpP class)